MSRGKFKGLLNIAFARYLPHFQGTYAIRRFNRQVSSSHSIINNASLVYKYYGRYYPLISHDTLKMNEFQ